MREKRIKLSQQKMKKIKDSMYEAPVAHVIEIDTQVVLMTSVQEFEVSAETPVDGAFIVG